MTGFDSKRVFWAVVIISVPRIRSRGSRLLYVFRYDVGFSVVSGEHFVGVGVGDEFFSFCVEGKVAAESVGDVCEVGQDGGFSAVFDFAYEFGAFCCADCVDEVFHEVAVVRALVGFHCFVTGARFVFSSEECFPSVSPYGHPSFCSVEEISGASQRAVEGDFLVGVHSSHFELENCAIVVFVDGDLCVGGFL